MSVLAELNGIHDLTSLISRGNPFHLCIGHLTLLNLLNILNEERVSIDEVNLCNIITISLIIRVAEEVIHSSRGVNYLRRVIYRSRHHWITHYILHIESIIINAIVT
jgi:hypothetical protein